MKRLLKWFLLSLSSLLGLTIIGVAVVYVFVGHSFGKSFDVSGSTIDVPDGLESVAEGRRLATLRGCTTGCHGDGSTGQVFFDLPDGTRMIAPDLAKAADTYTTEDLERLIRHGVRPDGTSLLMVMPSEMFYNVSDEDLGAIIAYLRSLTPREEPWPETRFGPLARVMLFYFGRQAGGILAAEHIDHNSDRLDPAVDRPLPHGEYLAKTLCTECHWSDLRGAPDGFSPSLAITVAYSIEDFRKLMRTGEPIGGRELDLMEQVAKSRFSSLTDPEIDDLHTYLQTLAASN